MYLTFFRLQNLKCIILLKKKLLC